MIGAASFGRDSVIVDGELHRGNQVDFRNKLENIDFKHCPRFVKKRKSKK